MSGRRSESLVESPLVFGILCSHFHFWAAGMDVLVQNFDKHACTYSTMESGQLLVILFVRPEGPGAELAFVILMLLLNSSSEGG